MLQTDSKMNSQSFTTAFLTTCEDCFLVQLHHGLKLDFSALVVPLVTIV